MIEEYTNEEKILAMNFTETWLEKTIEENANIEGYNIFRCDRKKRRGGVAIYLHEKVEAEIICEIRHKGCEMVAINIPELQTINIVVYRLPETKKMVFDKILNEIEIILVWLICLMYYTYCTLSKPFYYHSMNFFTFTNAVKL